MTGDLLAQMAFMQTVWGMRKVPYLAVRPVNHSGETPIKAHGSSRTLLQAGIGRV